MHYHYDHCKRPHVNLLDTTDGGKSHYVLVKDFGRLVLKQYSKVKRHVNKTHVKIVIKMLHHPIPESRTM